MVILITGTSRGIGKYLVEYYTQKAHTVFGCSRKEVDYKIDNYHHYCLDVADESAVKKMFTDIRKEKDGLDVVINNAGIASMNHFLLTPIKTINNILQTNVIGTALFCREAAKIMMKGKRGRIINFSTSATPLNLEGEAAYASSKAAVESLTKILAKEFADFGITVNAVGPTPVRTDLIRSVPKQKMDDLVNRQVLKRFGEFIDISNVIDFFIKPESDFITGQIIFLGGL